MQVKANCVMLSMKLRSQSLHIWNTSPREIWITANSPARIDIGV